ncbi:Hypothetical predicted protein [Octopus vulgaris]|uniref:Dynein assembly factor 3 C-terminal domain-containing protein n=1 Tax=Octopus vulgaris TaxID=6645 RepID=A0AA36FCX9_OCTVU|nr:Hypothetical predicted protein [Octopus vulgaris]
MCWETRLRSYLQTRYDTKMNAFDWDYHMRLVEKGADVIDKHEYKKWRNIGVAFENRDGDYVLPNTTLASGIILMKNGERINLRGYWGDILVGPYIAMGIESDFKELFKKFNGYYRKTARNVTEHNLTSMFHTIMTGETYIPPKETGTTDNKVTESIPVDSFKVTFLPFDAIKSMPLKEQYKHLFDIIYFSNSSIHNLIPEITPIFSNQTKIIIETAKFMLDLRKEKLQDFIDKATEKIHSVGCKVSYPVDAQKDAFIKFNFERENC